jgi:hypothetical protein
MFINFSFAGWFRRFPLILFCIWLLSSVSAQAMTVDGIKLQDSLKLGEAQLHLNGAGKRSKFFIDFYVAGLYLIEQTDNPQKIVEDNALMMLQLHVISKLINSENLTKGTREGFSKATNGQTESIQDEIDSFLDAFKEPINIGDVFEIVYMPENGITVIKNRKIAKRMPVSLEFKRALFGIWLSDKPAQNSLKKALLGK